MKKLIIVPTYNEQGNIDKIIKKIFSLALPELEILVVDDDSSDGTATEVLRLKSVFSGLHLLPRQEKKGLGPAYLDGFAWALENGFELIIQMDADLSHNPAYLEKMIKAASRHDFVVGSRYAEGGGIADWSWMRKIISSFGNWYARAILGSKIKDLTGGFNVWHAEIFRKINLKKIKSNGYGFQIELKYRAEKNGFIGSEIPIIFRERTSGRSKMSFPIILEAIWLAVKLKIFS